MLLFLLFFRVCVCVCVAFDGVKWMSWVHLTNKQKTNKVTRDTVGVCVCVFSCVPCLS
jgi:hypothetical protein